MATVTVAAAGQRDDTLRLYRIQGATISKMPAVASVGRAAGPPLPCHRCVRRVPAPSHHHRPFAWFLNEDEIEQAQRHGWPPCRPVGPPAPASHRTCRFPPPDSSAELDVYPHFRRPQHARATSCRASWRWPTRSDPWPARPSRAPPKAASAQLAGSRRPRKPRAHRDRPVRR